MRPNFVLVDLEPLLSAQAQTANFVIVEDSKQDALEGGALTTRAVAR